MQNFKVKLKHAKNIACNGLVNIDKLCSIIERCIDGSMLTDEYRYKILKLLEANPEISQRDLAHELDISLGRVNFCLKALIEKGLLKATNFRNSKNKLTYMYLLTPSGIEEKTVITARFLKLKMQEHANLQAEIEELRKDSNLTLSIKFRQLEINQ